MEPSTKIKDLVILVIVASHSTISSNSPGETKFEFKDIVLVDFFPHAEKATEPKKISARAIEKPP
jgi:hypothetical protein